MISEPGASKTASDGETPLRPGVPIDRASVLQVDVSVLVLS